MFDLSGKVALITGGTKGMGLSMAEGLAAQGAVVVVSSRKQDGVDAAVEHVRRVGACHGIAANAGDREQMQALVDKTTADHGAPDIVIGNAGVNPHYGSSFDIDDEAWDKTMATNVRSNNWLANFVAPGMKEKGGGSIVFTASVAAFHASPVLGTYGVSKIAVLGLMRNLALELGPAQIRVNAICPGLIKTDFANALWENPDAAAKVIKGIPLGRLGEADDLKGLAVFLGADESKYITGQAFSVCGGGYMWR